MGIWLADLYSSYVAQSLPKKCIFIFVQYTMHNSKKGHNSVKFHIILAGIFWTQSQSPRYSPGVGGPWLQMIGTLW